MSRIVYSRHYNIGFLGLERLHPFDSRKYSRAYRLLKKHFGRSLHRMTVRPSRPVTREELQAVHQPDYLDRLSDSTYVARALELPPLKPLPGWLIDQTVLRPMRWATMGTVIAAREALQHGFAVNLGGGYHHAKPFAGEGFCIYSDIALAVQQTRAAGLIGDDCRVAYIDLDAHQGNGVCHAFRKDDSVFLFDMYNSEIYPLGDADARDRIDCGIRLKRGCGDSEYLGLLQGRLPGFIESISREQTVGLAIYNAGTDVLAGDPLGQLGLSAPAILERYEYVVRTLIARGIPTVMLLSGGYTSASYRLVANSVINLLERTEPSGPA